VKPQELLEEKHKMPFKPKLVDKKPLQATITYKGNTYFAKQFACISRRCPHTNKS